MASKNQQDEEEIHLEEIPPIGYLLGAFLALAIFTSAGFYSEQPWIFLGLTLLTLGIAVGTGYKMRLKYEEEGLMEAIKWAKEPIGDVKSSSSSNTNDTDKTPPAPESLKSDLIFDRAEQKCEWCEERTDSPEVHHIKPRSEGGPNTKDNLIVLCPECHRKADTDYLSETKLKQKVKRIQAKKE